MEGVQEDNSTAANSLNDLLASVDPLLLVGIAFALLVVIFTIVLLALRSASSNRRSVLLVGLCDSGKTLLFSQLIHKKSFATQTSIVENSATYEMSSEKKRSLTLVDIPGHERVRQQYFDKFKSVTRGIIFVIDSMTFQKELKDVAELLYQVLTDKTVNKSAPSLLIACNKHDQTLAKGARLIQSSLEKELNNVRKTRSAALQATDGAVTSTFLGRHDRDFAFTDLHPMHVEFSECSAKGPSSDVAAIKDWLVKLA